MKKPQHREARAPALSNVVRVVVSRLAVLSLALLACKDLPTQSAQVLLPVIGEFTVENLRGNVLAAVATVAVANSDSVQVAYSALGDGASHSGVSSAVHVTGSPAVVPVLALLPNTLYAMRVTAFGGDTVSVSEPVLLETGTLPLDLPAFAASGSDPAPGFVVFSSGKYGLVIDNTGMVVWYHEFPEGAGLAFIPQANGRFTTRAMTATVGDIEPWVEVDVLGNITRTLTCADGLIPRLHELLVELDDSYWVMCDEERAVDLSAHGGVANARAIGTVLQHIGAEGEVRFEWNAFEHLSVLDLDLSDRSGAVVNFTHGNSFAFTETGDVIVSFRSLSQIVRIERRTGTILWRLGGATSTMATTGNAQFFRHQHSVRWMSNGGIMVLDNSGTPGDSQIEEWRIDEDMAVATMARAHSASPPAYTAIGGSVQPLPGGGVLVSYGTAGRLEEHDAQGEVRWRLEGYLGYIFRAERIARIGSVGCDVSCGK